MEPVSGETMVLPTNQASEEQAEKVIAASRENFTVEWKTFKTKANSIQKETTNDQDDEEPDSSPQTEALDA